jgi:hypothetical protein
MNGLGAYGGKDVVCILRWKQSYGSNRMEARGEWRRGTVRMFSYIIYSMCGERILFVFCDGEG